MIIAQSIYLEIQRLQNASLVHLDAMNVQTDL